MDAGSKPEEPKASERARTFLDLQDTPNDGPYTGYSPCFGILGYCFGHFGGTGSSRCFLFVLLTSLCQI